MTAGLRGSAAPLHEHYDCALLDLDGVVYRGPDPVPHAAEAIAAARATMATVFVTNNASRTPEQVAEHLTQLGVATGPGEVTTAAMAAALMVAQTTGPDDRILVIGGRGLHEAITSHQLTTVSSADEQPTVVVQGFSPELAWKDLAEAAYAIGRGARHVASNLDASLPTEHGFAPGNGALVGAVSAATRITPQSTGKPAPEIFHQAAAQVGGKNSLVVGDRLDTDLAGANAANLPGLHVATGVDGPVQVLRAPADQRPTYLGADLRSLLTSHPQPHHEDSWWHCGAAGVHAAPDHLRIRSGGVEREITATSERRAITLDELRAAACAVWAASDDLGSESILSEEFAALQLELSDEAIEAR